MSSIFYCEFCSFLFYSFFKKKKIRSTFICLFPVFGSPPGLHASSPSSDSVTTFTRSFISFRAAQCSITVFSPILGINSSYPSLVQVSFFLKTKQNKKQSSHNWKFCFLFGTHEHYNISPKQNSFNSVEHVVEHLLFVRHHYGN